MELTDALIALLVIGMGILCNFLGYKAGYDAAQRDHKRIVTRYQGAVWWSRNDRLHGRN